MKSWIIKALVIAVIVLIIQIVTRTTEGGLGILIAFAIGFIFSGIAELIFKGISPKKK